MEKLNYSLIILSLSFVMLFGLDASGSNKSKKPYKLPVISDVESIVSFDQNLILSDRSIDLSISHQSYRGTPVRTIQSAFPTHFVKSVVEKSSSIMTSYLRDRGVPTKDCRGHEYNLNIYIVTKYVLQDEERFRSFYLSRFGVSTLVGHTLYGYYDSTPEIKNNSTILITDIGSHINEEVLAHELAHYWWDRLCVQPHVSDDPEAFARDFQKYYMRKK